MLACAEKKNTKITKAAVPRAQSVISSKLSKSLVA